MKQSRQPQINTVFNFLYSGRTLSAYQAEQMFGIRSLKQRVHDLRNEGVDIVTVKNTKGETAYALAD